MKRALLLLGLGLTLLACSRMDLEQEPEQIISEEICFTAYANDVETKTERQSDGSVFWNPGDAVSLFFNQGDHGGNRFVAQNTEVSAIAEFRGTITGFAGGGESTGGEFWFWGVYPYSEDNSCDGTSITLTLPAQQTAKAGTFANGLFPTMAKSQGLSLGFYNICGGFKFTVSRDDITAVKFRGNANEDIAGKAKIVWDSNGHPAVSEHLVGYKEVTVTAPNNGTFVPGIEYYIVFYPELLSEGFTLTFITSASKQGSFTYSSSRQLRRGIFVNGPNLDTYVTSWTDAEVPSGQEPSGSEGGTESGLYLGMSTFERYLTYYPTHLISEETLESYNDIVDNLELTTLNGTALYYSIDEDITSMQSLTLPNDLFNVSIVTFTDGLDEGSLSYRRGVYKTKAEYLDALHTRLTNEQVSGLPIKSYAIGLKGTDAQSNLTEFRNNLEKIASTPENANEQYVYEISSINELNSSFESIADQLSQNIRVQKVIVSIPYPEDGERKRFTLDNKAPAQSTKYIEGVVDIDNLQLTNVVYYGLTSTSGSVVPISADNWFDLEFTFEGIQTLDGTEIVQDNIQLWYIPASGSSWQRNTEFSPSENSSVYTEKKSALVLLNLDLSKSLEGQLPTLKTGVKSFLSKLYAASVDPNVVKTVRLNKTELNLKVGQSETLQANVSPSTAPLSSLHWTSSIPSVATVDQNGRVTGVSEGTTIISVYSENGKELATCTTIVSFQHVESISLNITEKTLYVGKTVTLVATVYPSYASDKSVVWTSSNALVASVNSTGKVTGVANGTATITATTTDGGRSATCTIVVAGDPPCSPSSTPIDLSLAVIIKETGDLGYITQSELQYADMSEYDPLGLTILSESENFIIAMEDASSEPIDRGEVELYKNTPNFYYDITEFYNLPTYNQGVIISSRWDEINNALQQIGGESFKRYTWTKSYKASNNSLSLYAIAGSGGSLYSPWSYDDVYVREVIPLENAALNCFITKTKGIYFSYLNNSQRCFVNALSDVPPGCSVDGVAVSSSTGKGNVVISLADASSSPMTWSGATTSFGSTNLPSKDQALLISARLSEINTALEESGGNKLITFNLSI